MHRYTPIFLLLLACAPGAIAQQLYLSAGASHLAFQEEDRTAWQEFGTGIGLDGLRSDAYIEVLRSERFNRPETRILLDVYRVVSDRVYGNVRWVHTADARVHPGTDVLAEVYFTLSDGWEPSVQVRRMTFSRDTADIGALALGRYMGRHYMRVQVVAATTGGPASFSGIAMIRRFRNDVDYLELRAAGGREVVELARSFQAGTAWSVGVGASLTLKSGVRVAPALTAAHDEVLGSRVGLSARIHIGR